MYKSTSIRTFFPILAGLGSTITTICDSISIIDNKSET